MVDRHLLYVYGHDCMYLPIVMYLISYTFLLHMYIESTNLNWHHCQFLAHSHAHINFIPFSVIVGSVEHASSFYFQCILFKILHDLKNSICMLPCLPYRSLISLCMCFTQILVGAFTMCDCIYRVKMEDYAHLQKSCF